MIWIEAIQIVQIPRAPGIAGFGIICKKLNIFTGFL